MIIVAVVIVCLGDSCLKFREISWRGFIFSNASSRHSGVLVEPIPGHVHVIEGRVTC